MRCFNVAKSREFLIMISCILYSYKLCFSTLKCVSFLRWLNTKDTDQNDHILFIAPFCYVWYLQVGCHSPCFYHPMVTMFSKGTKYFLFDYRLGIK